MKKLLFSLAAFVTSVTSFSQTETPVSNKYVLDGETGELIQIVQPSEQKVQYVNQTTEQPQQIIVVENQPSKVEAVTNTVANVVTAAVITGSLIHAIKHHHHHRHHFHCPPPRRIPVYYRPYHGYYKSVPRLRRHR